MTKDTFKTPPNLRMLTILDVIGSSGQHVSVQDLVDHLGWPKQSLHRLVQSLVETGYLERQGRRYKPARQLTQLASGIMQFAPDLNARRQILTRLSADSGETVNFVMPMEDGMTYVDRVDTNWPFRILLPVGTSVPFHCTASGKTFLAHLRSDQRQKMLKSLTLEEHTPNTHTDIEGLSHELNEIRRQGFAMDDEEFFDNMFAIAVPVFDHRKRYYAALATHGPKQRFSKKQALALVDQLKNYAAQITALTFGSDDRINNRNNDHDHDD